MDATPPTLVRPIAWHHLRMRVPLDWEVTAYSVEDRAGRLEFGTREGLMGVVSWEPCAREPEPRTTMLAFLQRHVAGAVGGELTTASTLQTAAVGPFLLGWVDDTLPCQALAYAPEAHKLIRWILEPGALRDGDWPRTVEPLLTSFDFNAEPLAEYCLHGIHARLPRDYKIEDMVILPANVMMAFESSAGKRRATFRRWGLPEMLLAGASLEAFHTRILKTHGITVQGAHPCRVNDMEACRLTIDAPREHHMDRFMGRRWPGGMALLWHDRAARRLHAFEQAGPERSEPLDFETTFPGLTLHET